MSKDFDPYRDWLHITDDRRPLTHYQLLGLPACCDDADKIQAAALERIGHVRKYQVGMHAVTSQQLINELSGALACLTNAPAKAAYDRQLSGAATLSDTPAALQTVVRESPAGKAANSLPATGSTIIAAKIVDGELVPTESPIAPDDAQQLEKLPPELEGAKDPSLDALASAAGEAAAAPPQSGLAGTNDAAPASTQSRGLLYGLIGGLAAVLLLGAVGVVGALLSAAGRNDQDPLAAKSGTHLENGNELDNGRAKTPDEGLLGGGGAPGDPATDGSLANGGPPQSNPAPGTGPMPMPGIKASSNPPLQLGQQGTWRVVLQEAAVIGTSGWFLVRDADGPPNAPAYEALAQNPSLVSGSADYATDLETDGKGSVVLLTGAVDPPSVLDISPFVVANAARPRIVIHKMQIEGNDESLVEVGGFLRTPQMGDGSSGMGGPRGRSRTPTPQVTDGLASLLRWRLPDGMPMQFNAVYQSFDERPLYKSDNKKLAAAVIVSPTAGSSYRVPVTFGVPADQLSKLNYRSGDLVQIEGWVGKRSTPGQLVFIGVSIRRKDDPVASLIEWQRPQAVVFGSLNSLFVGRPLPALPFNFEQLATSPGGPLGDPALVPGGVTGVGGMRVGRAPGMGGMPGVGVIPGGRAQDYASSEKTWMEISQNPEKFIGQKRTLQGTFASQNAFTYSVWPPVVIRFNSTFAALTLQQPTGVAMQKPKLGGVDELADGKAKLRQLTDGTAVEVEICVVGGQALQPQAIVTSLSRVGVPDSKVELLSSPLVFPLVTIGDSSRTIFNINWSPNGARLAVVGSRLNVWNVADKQDLWSPAEGFSRNSTICWSPDSNTLAASTSSAELLVYSFAQQSVVARFVAVNGYGSAVSYSPDGSQIAVVGVPQGDAKLVKPGGSMLAVNPPVTVWDLPTMKEAQQISGVANATAVSWSPDGKLLAIGGQAGVFLCRPGSNKKWGTPQTFVPSNGVQGLWWLSGAWLPSGDKPLLGGLSAQTIGVWDPAAKGKKEALFATNSVDTRQARQGAFSYDGRRMAQLTNGMIVVHDVTGKHVAGAPQAGGAGGAMQPGGPGLNPAVMRNAMANVPHVERTHNAMSVGGTYLACSWSPINQLLAVGSSLGQVHLFDEATGDEIASLPVGALTDLEWSPLADRLATANSDGKVRIWDTTEHAQADAGAQDPPAGVAQPAAAGGLSAEFLAKSQAIHKLISDEMWDEVHAQIADLEAGELSAEERTAVKTRIKAKLVLLAKNAIQSAGRVKNQDVDKYVGFLEKAIAIDPDGDVGKQAAKLLE